MPYPGDMRASALGDILAWCQKATAQDCIATLQSLSQLLQIDVLRLLRLPVGAPVAGPDANGAAPSGNPVQIGGVTVTNTIKPFKTDNNGDVFALALGNDDVATPRGLMVDRAGILAVAPPVSKLVIQASLVAVAGGGAAGLNAPGAGLRNVVLGWWYSIACGANALAPADLVFTGTVAPSAPSVCVACPVNDSRFFSGAGPLLGTANTAVNLTMPAGPANSRQACGIFGYVAGLP